MATASRTEYISIDGLPLSTAAWETEDISTLLNGPGTRGSDLVIPTRAGASPRRRTLDARQITIPIVVNGFLDSDGNAHANPRDGLVANIDELKAALSPKYTTQAGTKTLLWVNDTDIYRTAEVHVSPDFQVSAIGPNAARLVVTATIPGGVLRGGGIQRTSILVESGTTQAAASFGPIMGTGEIQDALIYIDGPATWPAPVTALTGNGAPTPGDGTTGDYWIDEDTGDLYGPKSAGNDWPGPLAKRFVFGAPGAGDIGGYTHVIDVSNNDVYGPRTTAAPDSVDIRFSNYTYDSTGAVFLEFIGTIDDRLVIDCGQYSATLGSTAAGGSITTGGTAIWLPMYPGVENQFAFELTTNAADCYVAFETVAVYL